MEAKLCGICENKLKKSDGQNKLRAEKLWPKILKLAEFRNKIYEKERYICDKCRCPLIKIVLPTDPVAAANFSFKKDPIVKETKNNNLKAWRNKEKYMEIDSDFDIDSNEAIESHTSASSESSNTSGTQSSQNLSSQFPHSSQSLSSQLTLSSQNLTSQLPQSSQSVASQLTLSSQAHSSQLSLSSQSLSSQLTLSSQVPSSQFSQSSQTSSLTNRLNTAIININLPSCSSSQRCCFICRDVSGRTSISSKARVDAFLKRKIIIPEGNRCCAVHLTSTGNFTHEALINITASTETTLMTPENIAQFMSNIADAQTRSTKPMLNFEDDSFTEVEFKMLTGLTRQNFETIFDTISSYLRDSKNRSTRNALAMFFVKLRLNVPQTVLALLFGLPNQERVSENFNRIMDILHDKFVPLHLGYSHITRARAKTFHQTLIATSIHEIPEVSLGFTLDGTYLPCEKPSALADQRALWSVQKGCTLVKPMMITFTDGYILEMPKCFAGKLNDATILNKIMEWENSLTSFINSGDYFIVDRGFRDSIKLLEEKNINVIMPPLLAEGQQQFTADEANRMRLVTMARFVVEVVNGRIKMKFKFFNDIIKASYLPKITKLFRITCSVMNAFSSPIISNLADGQSIIDSALKRNFIINELSKYVTMEGIENKRVIWEPA